MNVVILTESELRRAVTIDSESVAAIEQVFGRLAEDAVNMPPIMHIEVPEYEGDVDIKSAYVRGLDSFAVKIGAGFFNNQSQCFKMGELHHGIAAGLISENADIVELGQIVAGRKSGRAGEDQITICDLTGTGAQDKAIAVLALKKAAALELGQATAVK